MIIIVPPPTCGVPKNVNSIFCKGEIEKGIGPKGPTWP